MNKRDIFITQNPKNKINYLGMTLDRNFNSIITDDDDEDNDDKFIEEFYFSNSIDSDSLSSSNSTNSSSSINMHTSTQKIFLSKIS